ncbi:heat shock protein beta-9 [Perognathus longimembris pacificus]|uniref:heat shock protein beta-9 n=1 Tax=Perognathus longimembris pacificus TaxID=214514 RepID=UPI0020193F0B|nr:heat shock protein beta-9 [Perognathus longimembris pacificus]
MQRVSGSFSTESRVAPRFSNVSIAERNQVATLPVRVLRDEGLNVNRDHAQDDFQVKMDAFGFAPEELVVQVDGQSLVVTGQRQQEGSDPVRGSYRRMEQKVHRQMLLPPDLDPAAMSCCLTPSGQLWVRGQCRTLPLPQAHTDPSLRPRRQGSN